MMVLRRTMAVSVLLLLISVLVLTIVIPLARLWAGQEMDDRRAALARLRRLAAEEPLLTQRIQAFHSALAESSLLWHAASLAAESSEIQGRIRTAFLQNGGDVQATTDLTPVQVHGLWRIGVGVDATASTPAFSAALASLETAKPKLFIEDLRVQAPSSSGVFTSAPILVVHMVVAGYGLPK